MKNKLLKVTILGLSLSVLVSGTALAQGEGISSSFSGISSEETDYLLKRQDEINSLVFNDHARDIEKKGFQIIYTGVADDYVEVGINPFSKDKSDFLYEIIGKDQVKVVASDEVVLYTSEPIEEPVLGNADDADDDAPNKVIMDTGLDTPVSSTDDIGLAADGMLADEDKLEIQIESVDGEKDELSPEEAEELSKQSGMADDKIVENTSVDAELDSVTTTDTAAETLKEEKGLSTPLIIAIVAGGVLILGGALLVFKKK